MIDFEVQIFNAVHSSVAPLCAKNAFRSVHTPVPTVFPTATLYELSNVTDRVRRSTSTTEDFAVITYQAHVYAQSKAECRSVFSALDNAMIRLGFNRFSGDFTPNTANSKVFEYIARYQAEIDPSGVIYRRR